MPLSKGAHQNHRNKGIQSIPSYCLYLPELPRPVNPVHNNVVKQMNIKLISVRQIILCIWALVNVPIRRTVHCVNINTANDASGTCSDPKFEISRLEQVSNTELP